MEVLLDVLLKIVVIAAAGYIFCLLWALKKPVHPDRNCDTLMPPSGIGPVSDEEIERYREECRKQRKTS